MKTPKASKTVIDVKTVASKSPVKTFKRSKSKKEKEKDIEKKNRNIKEWAVKTQDKVKVKKENQ